MEYEIQLRESGEYTEIEIQEKLKGKELNIKNDHINTLFEDRIYCNEVINDPNKTPQEKRICKGFIHSLNSSASNDFFEGQLSQVFGITNIDTKHGWDGNDHEKNEPYEYKPTKITNNNYFGANVNINDESENKINNISPHKVNYNNSEAWFIISPINKGTSEFICIYKFKESILYNSRIENLNKPRKPTQRCVYGTNIKKCIELSHKNNEMFYKWHNPKFF